MMRRLYSWVAIGLAVLLLLPLFAQARGEARPVIAEVALASLPPEARETFDLIKRGGPYPYPRDGVVFGNYERLLPQHDRGYYREYTVPTPGASNRGARRLIAGGNGVDFYYTADHYRSFKRVRE
jgi:ribonuclease T1